MKNSIPWDAIFFCAILAEVFLELQVQYDLNASDQL